MIGFNSFGYMFLYFHNSISFKKEAFEKISTYIPKEKLTLITLNKYESGALGFNYEDDSEIKYNGCMFDICEREIKNDVVYLYCLSDENEDALNSSFCEFVSRNLNENSKNIPTANIIKNISFDCILEFTTMVFSISNNNTTIDNYAFLLFEVYLTPPTPPPKNNISLI